MLIRSQNKKVLVAFEFLPDIEVSCGVISARRDMGWCLSLGEYSTNAKAMKVLDMMQKRYEEYETERIYKEGTYGIETFQMPEDSEVV